METSPSLDTGWTRSLRQGATPDHASLRDHLAAVHTHSAGFTESCAAQCRDGLGRNSYEWLAEIVDPARAADVLDLACGSGPLLALCRQRHQAPLRLVGMDMSAEELALARTRLPSDTVTLHQGLAQDLSFLDDASMDAVLCHWALTLMDPVEPVLVEANRVLRPGGTFAAIVDGAMTSAPGYREVHDLIYGWVQKTYPHYGQIDMGDPRIRNTQALADLASTAFHGADVAVEPAVLTLDGTPDFLAREAAGFFYASFVLPAPDHAGMLADLTGFFAASGSPTAGRFAMPINRLVVRRL